MTLVHCLGDAGIADLDEYFRDLREWVQNLNSVTQVPERLQM